jgi:hypothetical protein
MYQKLDFPLEVPHFKSFEGIQNNIFVNRAKSLPKNGFLQCVQAWRKQWNVFNVYILQNQFGYLMSRPHSLVVDTAS